MELQDYLKTAESRSVVQEEKVFCVGGLLWQGHRGGPMPVEETQLTMQELREVDDKDGTMHEVWFRISQRLESRHVRKVEEYGKRRTTLRGERQSIRESLKHDRELGLKPSPADVQEVERIDRRMERLQDPQLEEDYYYALEMAKPASERKETKQDAKPDETVPCCDICGERPPPNKNPRRWLAGHRMGKHTDNASKRKRKKKVASA